MTISTLIRELFPIMIYYSRWLEYLSYCQALDIVVKSSYIPGPNPIKFVGRGSINIGFNIIRTPRRSVEWIMSH